MKKDKFEEGPMPRLVRIEALSPLKPDEPFSSLVRLPKDAPWDPTVAEGLTNCNLEGQEVPLFQDVFKALKQWVRERLPGTNHRVALIAWDAWYRDQLVFKTECERRGKTVPHHWTWFSLNYVKNCVVRGFWNEDESSVEKLLKHYRITPTGCSVRDLGLLYDCLLGYADQRKVLEAMFEFPSVIPVAQVALEAQQAEPVFFDLETTGLIEYRRRADKPRFYEKDEKGNKIVEKWPGITQIAAFFPSRLERIEALPLEELAAGATLYQFAGLGKEHLPLHPGTVSLRIGEKVYPESALKIDYESGKFQLNFPEPAAAAQVTLSFTHEAKAWFQHYVRPEVPIDPEAEKITGITLDPSRQTGRVVCVSDCPTFKEVGRLFFEKVFEGCTQGKRPVLIAHNCWHFDKPILENMCQKAGLVVKDLSWFDTLYLAAKVFGGGIKGNGINDLCTHYGIRQREGHKADSDVAAMYGIVQHLFEGCDPTKLYNLMLKKQALEKVYREIVRYRPLPEFSCEELEFDL